jgi:putative ATPase
MAAVLAAAAVQICEFVGLPEAQLVLAQAAVYIACSPKSNASSSAVWQALSDVKNEPILPVPKHLKDSHYAAAKKAGIGADYKYPHSFEDGFVKQEYLPAGIKKKYYSPKDIGYEKNIKNYLQKLQILLENSKSSR